MSSVFLRDWNKNIYKTFNNFGVQKQTLLSKYLTHINLAPLRKKVENQPTKFVQLTG